MSHGVVAAVFDDICLLDVVGPTEVFSTANDLSGLALYSLSVVHVGDNNAVRGESGLRLMSDSSAETFRRRIDTFLVPGGRGARPEHLGPQSMHVLGRLASRANRVASVCTGAFVLAGLGLLDDRRATTHWAHADELRTLAPDCAVVPDELFVIDGPVVTSAGVASGIDLALALVEADHGRDLARAVSRQLVVYLARSGGQSQFSERQDAHVDATDPLSDVIAAIVGDPADDHSVQALADRLAISPRHLTRLFRQRTGTTPARWVERVRCDRARDLLQRSELSIEAVACEVGFLSPITMRQAFHRVFGISPTDIRWS